MSGDSRKDFVLATVGNHFGFAVSDGAMSHISDCPELNRFLDDGGCCVLAAHAELVEGLRLVQTYNQLDVETAATDNWLVFFKLSPTVITPDNLHSNVLVSSLLESPLDTLYHTLQKVYSPVLLRDERWSRSVDPKIQSLLGDLEAGLGSALRRFGKAGIAAPSSTSEADESSHLSTILCPSDEFQFWAEAALSGAKLAQRERAQRFQELFQPITAKFANLDSLSFSEALELVEVTQDTLDDVWKETDFDPPYPEKRMEHLLEIVSDSFGRFVQRKLNGCGFWLGQFSQVRAQVQDGLMVCDKWSSATEVLTVQFWKQYSLHRWRGGPFVSDFLSQLTQRLEEVDQYVLCLSRNQTNCIESVLRSLLSASAAGSESSLGSRATAAPPLPLRAAAAESLLLLLPLRRYHPPLDPKRWTSDGECLSLSLPPPRTGSSTVQPLH